MKEFQSVDEILDFAMESEQQAVDFYTILAEKSKNSEMKELFLSFAREEMGHKARLAKIKTEGAMEADSAQVVDLKIADYLSPVKISAEMIYADALVLAMKREKASFKLYTELANRVSDASLKRVFSTLAQEEAKHKVRFEIEYDDNVMREN